METKSALSVFNDAMSLAKKVSNRNYQKKQLETKAWIFMIHNLLKGENFPVDDWFDSEAHGLFEVFFTYYSKHDCWEGFCKNILNRSGKMYGLFVAAAYCLEQTNKKNQKVCIQSLLKNRAIDDEVLAILSDYSIKYPILLDVMLAFLGGQKKLKTAYSSELCQIYLNYRETDEKIARKALEVFYLWLTKLERPVDVCVDYMSFLKGLKNQKVDLREKVDGYHLKKLQKILKLLAAKKASSEICRMILHALDCQLYSMDDKLSVVEMYLDDFIASARESDLISALSRRIVNEEFSVKMLSLLSEIQRKIGDNQRLSLELLVLIDEAWREDVCVRMEIIDREAFGLSIWEHIDAYLQDGVFAPREKQWLELSCKVACFASGDVGYFSTQPLWFALKLKKLIATYPVLEKFKREAEQIFDNQMEVLESFLEEECNYVYWAEWKPVLDELWCTATASEIAKLVHLLAGYESENSPMKVWAKSKNFGFTNWGEKLKYTAQVNEILKALDVD